MKTRRRWTLEQLSEAVKCSKSFTQVLTKLGLSNSSTNFSRIHKICDDNNFVTTHFIYKGFNIYSEQLFKEAVKQSFSIAQALSVLGLNASGGGNYRQFAQNVKKYNVDTSHFTGQGHLKNKTHSWARKTALEEILVENSSWTCTNGLRRRLIKEKILIEMCSECGISDWNEKPVSFELDHINGKRNDNRIENLRILCPNCHSQTKTYCSKNMKVPQRLLEKFNIDYNLEPWAQREIITNELSKASATKTSIRPVSICEECNGLTGSPSSNVCAGCYGSHRIKYRRQHKVPHPSKDELQKLLWEKSTVQLSKQFGVSDKAIEKWAKKYGCTKPPRGYWAKKVAGKI